MERKLNDLFMDVVASPDATYLDFINVGYSPENTSLLDISVYKNNDWVRDHFKDLYGNFNEGAFQETYDEVQSMYNNLAVEDREKFIRSQITYHRDNIFAPRELRRRGPDFLEVKMVNPYRLVYGLTTLGHVEDPVMSVDEIAQSNKVLTNPTTAGDDLRNAKWDDTPNGNFGKYFWDTLVIAQYDEDGEHIDPYTGQKVKHSKGELKLNEDGEFYYEKLDGRSIYGRQVLNKANILTIDGTKLNKYDFFDSDDLELKSIAGSLLKNAALVGSMFIPYVGPVVLTATLATLVAGIAATFGKMLLGSDSPTLSAIEGWSASMDRRRAKTQYAQEHPWCWESFITMIGDFTEIGATLRFLFSKVPQLMMGEDVMTEAGQARKLEELMETEKTLANTKVSELLANSAIKEGEKGYQQLLNTILTLKSDALISAAARVKLLPLVELALTLGHTLSKGYMALSIANDMYGEAKTLGASDLDATLLTLGYTAGLYAFLNAGVSLWIFPELRAEGYRALAIAKALVSKDKELENLTKQLGVAIKSFDKKAKKDYVKRVFNIGKKIANAEYANGTKTLSATVAAGVGMGVEGMGFEFLSDFSKGCYDVVKWLQGSDRRMDTFGYNFEEGEWHPGELALGYGSNFLSAVAGGTITGFFGTYRAMRGLSKITHQLAILEAVYMVRNGKAESFLKLVDKMELGNKYLSTSIDPRTRNFLPGTDDNNLDLANKTAIHEWMRLISNILDAHGANISDLEFLDILVLKELRFAVLQRSPLAGLYLDDFNTASSDLIRVTSLLNERNLALQDKNGNKRIEDNEKVKEANPTTVETDNLLRLKQRLDLLATLVNELVSGKKAYEFIRRTMYDLTGILSLDNSVNNLLLWCYIKYGKRYEDLSNIDKNDALNEYKTWMETEGREHTRDAADISHLLSLLSSKTITEQVERYINSEKRTTELRDLNHRIQRLLLPEAQFKEFDFNKHEIQESNIPAEAWLNIALESLEASVRNTLIALIRALGSDEVKNSIKEKGNTLNRISEEYNKATTDNKDEKEIKSLSLLLEDALRDLVETISKANLDYLTDYVNQVIGLGYASTELKNLITRTLDIYTDNTYVKERGAYINAKGKLLGERPSVENDAVSLTGDAQKKAINRLAIIDESINNCNTEIARCNENINKINELITKLNDLDESPLVSNLDEFLKLVSSDKNRVAIRDVLEEVNNIYNRTPNDISRFNLETDLYKRLLEALSIMRLYRATIMAARTDNVDINNLYGYNATLNEIAEKMGIPDRLAEIDSTTADIFIEDLNTNISKLEYLYKLNTLNQGSKLNSASRISNRKDLLIYKRVSSIFSTTDPTDPLSKWNGLTELRSKIDEMTIHLDLLKRNSYTVDKDKEEAFEKEKISLEDAVYDFFNLNSDRDLTELINPDRLSLLEPVNDVLDETIENFSDNSMVWWLRDRAALKSSDFYSLFIEVINTEGDKIIVPTSAQEMGVYSNYASIVNGKMCDRFYNAFIESAMKYWKGLKVSDRLEILKKFGNDQGKIDKYSLDLMADYIINIIPLPTYKNGNFVEGIPGAGKSDGVDYFTVKLLLKFHPELLENVIIIHGGTQASALELCEKLGLKGTKGVKTFGPLEWVEYVGLKGKMPLVSTTTKELKVKRSDVGTTGEYNKLIPTFKTRDFNDDEKPRLIIVDEALRLDYFLMNSIEQVAEKLGISVINTGDLNQTGVRATFSTLFGNNQVTVNLGISRAEFSRTPKIGTSMRTDNIVKVRNLNAMRLYMENPTGVKPEFEYVLNNEGLFGDRIYGYDDPGTIAIDQDFRSIIDALVNTRNPKEKIGYITDSLDSPIFKYITENYKDAFDVKTLDAAAGKEAKYYVIDVSEPDDPNFLSNIYTGMSRAELGSVILTKNGNTNITDKRVNVNIKETLSESAKKIYTEKRKALLSKIVSPGAKIDVIPRDGSEQILTIPGKHVETKIDPSTDETADKGSNDTPPTDEESSNTTDEGPVSTTPGEEGSLFGQDELQLGESSNPEKTVADIPNNDNDLLVRRDLQYKEGFLDFDGGLGSEDVLKDEEDDLTSAIPPPVRIEIEQEGDILAINQILHTFHIFGIGMPTNGDSIDVDTYSPEVFKSRIDGGNGLIKLMGIIPARATDEQVKEALLKVSVKALEQHIANLTSYIYAHGNKETLLSKILAYLKANFNNINTDNLFIDFAFKLSPHTSEHNREIDRNRVEEIPTPLTQTTDEKNNYSHTTDPRGSEMPEKKIVAIIGRKVKDKLGYFKRRNLLELNLFGLTSPLTILLLTDGNGRHYFGDIYEYYRLVSENNTKLIEISKFVLDVISKFGEGYPQYESLINLFKVFNYGYRELTYIATDKDGKYVAVNPVNKEGKLDVVRKFRDGIHKSNVLIGAYGLIEKILNESTWTPAKDLKLLGSRLMKLRGEHQITPDFIYSASPDPNDWVEIKEYVKDPRVKISSLAYISRTGTSNGRQIAEAGHPFVLVSFNLEMANDTEMIDYYVRLLSNPDLPRQVELYYVIPPAATVREYMNNLKTIFTSTSETRPNLYPIGQLFTSYRLVDLLLRDSEVLEFLKNTKGYTLGYLRDILQIIDLVSGLENRNNVVLELFSNKLVNDLILKHTEDRKFRLVKSSTSLSAFFDSILLDLGYEVDPDNNYLENETGLKLIEKHAPNGIRYNSKVIQNSKEYRGLLPVTQPDDYTINGQLYLINGKIDSYMFLGNLDPVIRFFLECSTMFRNNLSLSYSLDFYLNRTWRTYNNVLPSENKQVSDLKPTSELKPVLELKTKEPSNTINLAGTELDKGAIFKALKIEPGDKSIILEFEGKLVDDLNEKMSDGNTIYQFKMRIGETVYDAEFDNGRKKKLELKEENCSPGNNTITIKFKK